MAEKTVPEHPPIVTKHFDGSVPWYRMHGVRAAVGHMGSRSEHCLDTAQELQQNAWMQVARHGAGRQQTIILETCVQGRCQKQMVDSPGFLADVRSRLL